jgi:hypothetical protein
LRSKIATSQFLALPQTAELRDFRCNPGRMGEQERSSVPTSPLRGLRAAATRRVAANPLRDPKAK